MLEWRQTERPLLRALARELAAQPDWELVLLRTRPLASRPPLPRALRGRVRVRTALDGAGARRRPARGRVFVPASRACRGSSSRRGPPAPRSPRRRAGHEQPELAAAEAARLIEDDAFRARRAAEGRAEAERPELRRARRPRRRASTARIARRRRAGAPRRAARGPRLDPRRPAHAHDAGRTTARSRSTTCSTTRRRRASARSRSPTTTSSAARSRRSSRRAAAS